MTAHLNDIDMNEVERRLDEMGLTSINAKIEYFEQITPEEIDGTIKEDGVKTNEDIKAIVTYFSNLRDAAAAVAQQAIKMTESLSQLVANIDLENLGRAMFLFKLFKHVHGDVSVYETDIYSRGAEWGYTKEQIERFISYLEEKGYLETRRVFGKFTIAAVRITVKGVDYVENEVAEQKRAIT